MENDCNNCRYFIRHYTINNLRFTNVGGHCVNSELYGKIKNRNKIRTDCCFWEPYEMQVAERRKKIKDTIVKMEKQLADILVILNNENK